MTTNKLEIFKAEVKDYIQKMFKPKDKKAMKNLDVELIMMRIDHIQLEAVDMERKRITAYLNIENGWDKKALNHGAKKPVKNKFVEGALNAREKAVIFINNPIKS